MFHSKVQAHLQPSRNAIDQSFSIGRINMLTVHLKLLNDIRYLFQVT